MGSEVVERQATASQGKSTDAESLATECNQHAARQGDIGTVASAIRGVPVLCDRDPEKAVSIIPVGQEPDRQVEHGGDGRRELPESEGTGGGPSPNAASDRKVVAKKRGPSGSGGKNPGRFYRGRSRQDEVRIFTQETMHMLRRAEITVWLAIHNCQVDGAARISRTRIAQLAGTSERHVSLAVKSLAQRGLLEVLFKGRYQPNGSSGHGLAAIYRVYPRPEPRLLEKKGGDAQLKE